MCVCVCACVCVYRSQSTTHPFPSLPSLLYIFVHGFCARVLCLERLLIFVYVYTTAEWNFIHSVFLCSQLQLYYALVTSFHSPQDIAVFYPITSSVVRKCLRRYNTHAHLYDGNFRSGRVRFHISGSKFPVPSNALRWV